MVCDKRVLAIFFLDYCLARKPLSVGTSAYDFGVNNTQVFASLADLPSVRLKPKLDKACAPPPCHVHNHKPSCDHHEFGGNSLSRNRQSLALDTGYPNVIFLL
ncbi:hypothetical protein J6590_041121 [Homalodisca vitripennis]|nr:hypothetical protein J6590_041121 [Homalodisca vitripennis]